MCKSASRVMGINDYMPKKLLVYFSIPDSINPNAGKT